MADLEPPHNPILLSRTEISAIDQRTAIRNQTIARLKGRRGDRDQAIKTRKKPNKSKDDKKIKKLKNLKNLKSSGTPISEIRRYRRDERFKLEEKKILFPKRGASSIRPVEISGKMICFLTNAYLGNLYGNLFYGEDAVGGRIKNYLYFLNPKDPLYGITSRYILEVLMNIYIIVNRIQKYEINKYNGELTLIRGTKEPTELIRYFRDQFVLGGICSLVRGKLIQRVLDQIMLLNTSSANITGDQKKDFTHMSVRLQDSLEFSYKMARGLYRRRFQFQVLESGQRRNLL